MMKKSKRIRYYGTKRMVPRKWTVDEENFITNNMTVPMRELANKLQRTVKSVEHKKRRLKIERSRIAVNKKKEVM